MFIQKVDSVLDIRWNETVKYGDIYLQPEKEHSRYNFEEATVELVEQIFNLCEKEAGEMLNRGLVLPAYDQILKCSHAFNILDARGVISVTERMAYILRIRKLARTCARLYVEGK